MCYVSVYVLKVTGLHANGSCCLLRMDIIEERLQMTRGGMMLLAIVLGCDYLPGGVHGIGKDTVLRFLRVAYNAGDQDPTQR